MDQSESQIRGLLSEYENALNTSDADKATALYHTGGVFMPMGFPSSRGTRDIRAAYAGIFKAIRLKIDFTIDEIEIGDHDAIALTSSAGTVTVLANGAEAPEANREFFAFRKQDGMWKIYRYMFNKTGGNSN